MLNVRRAYIVSKFSLLLAATAVLFQNCGPGGFQTQVVMPNNVGLSLNDPSELSIKSPAAFAAVKSNVTLVGDCANGVMVEVSGDLVQPLSTVCSEKSYVAQIQLSTPDGVKNIRVDQTDMSGKKISQSRSFTRDTLPPAVSFMTPAQGATVGAMTLIQGLCEAGTNITLQEGASSTQVPCTSAGAFSHLLTLSAADGTKTIAISQADPAGNNGQATRTIIKDTAGPTIAISSPAANSTVQNGFTLAGTCESGIMVVIDGSGTLSSISTPCTSGTFSGPVSLSDGNGSKSVTASQTDPGGNKSSVTRTFNRMDTVAAPVVTISSPAENSVSKGGVALQGSCTNGLPVEISGSGIASAVSATCSSGNYGANLTLSGGDGVKNIVVSQTNASNVKGLVSRNFVRDATAPGLAISSPAANAPFNAAFTLTGTCESGISVVISGASSALSTNCTNGVFSQQITLPSGDGSKTISVAQTDSAGNTGTASRAFISDRTAPALTITAPAANTESETGVTVTGTCENALPVVVSGTGVSSSFSGTCSSGAFSLDVTFSTGTGDKPITLSQTDAAGNASSVSRTFKKIAPTNLDGTVLYAQYCASCHSNLATSTKLGRSASQITSAFTTIAQMSHLTTLTSAQVSAIATALAITPTGPNQSRFTCNPNQDPAPSRLERLTKREYVNTLQDLFGSSVNAVALIPNEIAALPNEDITKSFDSYDLNTTETHVTGYYEVADALSAKVVASTSYLTAIGTSCLSAAAPTATCVSSFIDSFGLKSFRRPMTSTEKSRFTTLYNTVTGQDGARSGLRVLILAFIQSPQFLYRVEDQGTLVSGRTDLYQVSAYEIASRLSYFALGSMPDAELFAAAANGSLNTQAGLTAQMERLFQSPKLKDKTHEFFSQWLRLNPAPPSTYPASYVSGIANLGGLRQAMVNDLNDFVDYVIWTAKGNYKTLMTSNVAVIRDMDMARIYGVTSATGQPVQLSASTRAGVLTRPVFLQASNTTNNPFHRGATILRRVLCNNIPSPDPNSQPDGTLTPPAFDPDKTTRERFTAKTSPASCIGCHSVINPIGFSLESFDSIGRFRTNEKIYAQTGDTVVNTLPIDSTGSMSIDGTQRAIESGIAMSVQIAGSQSGPACFVEHFHQFNAGRAPASEDGCKLLRMEQALTGTGGTIEKMISATVSGPEFRLRKVSP